MKLVKYNGWPTKWMNELKSTKQSSIKKTPLRFSSSTIVCHYDKNAPVYSSHNVQLYIEYGKHINRMTHFSFHANGIETCGLIHLEQLYVLEQRKQNKQMWIYDEKRQKEPCYCWIDTWHTEGDIERTPYSIKTDENQQQHSSMSA